MGRHSGFWTLAATLAMTVSTIAASLLESSHHLQSPRPSPFATNQAPLPGVTVDLPAGALVIIGSTDTSGAGHRVRLSTSAATTAIGESQSPDVKQANDCLPYGVRTLCPEYCTRRLAHEPEMTVERRTFPEAQRIRESAAGFDLDEWTNGETTESVRSVSSAVCDSPREPDHTLTHHAGSAVRLDVAPQQRAFLVPHFESHAVIHQPTQARCLMFTEHVAVYLDESLYRRWANVTRVEADRGNRCLGDQICSEPSEPIISEESLSQRTAEICRFVERQLPVTIVEWIGPIADVDGDGRLSVVISDLDRRNVSPMGEQSSPPVLGCVRPQDFLEGSNRDFAGDILYLDFRMPTEKKLEGLLAHELTHAAIASLPSEQAELIPSWLNEAVAHWVELQFTDTPTGFEERLRQFRGNPGQCPVVAMESNVAPMARRGGCRASAATFLQFCLDDPRSISNILNFDCGFAEAIAEIKGDAFEDVFRDWSIAQALTAFESAPNAVQCLMNNGEDSEVRVFGTSFLILKTDATARRLSISAEQAARLQITILAE